MLGLAVDTESSGLMVRGIEKDDAQYPFPVAMGCVLFRMNGEEVNVFGSTINAGDKKMQSGAIDVHGITERESNMEGVSPIVALAVLCQFAKNARYITGYNVNFDRNICEAALIALKKETGLLVRRGLTVVDLIGPCSAVCKIPSDHSSGGYRWPTLDVACATILGDPPRTGKHKALEDARKSMRLFLALRERRMLEVD